MARTNNQYRLFDLVMLVILAGLAFGFARCLSQIPQQHDSLPPSVIMIGIGFAIWAAVWISARTRRTGPACAECGPTDPVPMLTEQMQIVRQRFERLVDEPVDTPPLRVLVFDKRRAFLAYHRRSIADQSLFDCLYAGRPAHSLSLSTEPARLRLADAWRSMRTGFVMYLLESFKGYHPVYWLQSGTSLSLSTSPDGDGRELLNRRMKVALANGTALKAAELTSKLTTLRAREQMGSLVDHSAFARVMQLRGQSWSVIEYLAGEAAPPERLGRFRSFLSDLNRATSQEETFARQFGHGFDTLLEQWQTWVSQQPFRSDPVPPSEIRTAIIEMLVPAIRDRSKKAQDRIQAMRSMGATGYVLGADALIDVLLEADDRFTETATWALESISGLAYGSDPVQWSQWWASRDPKVISNFEFAESQ